MLRRSQISNSARYMQQFGELSPESSCTSTKSGDGKNQQSLKDQQSVTLNLAFEKTDDGELRIVLR